MSQLAIGSSAMKAFEQAVLPHLDAAYNLARWLVRDEHDAQDVAQEACMRACRHFGSYRGGNARAWLLKIVRNACHDRIAQNSAANARTERLEETPAALMSEIEEPPLQLQRRDDVAAVRNAIQQLPTEYREIVLLREMEDLSYKEIADIADVPIGTVMSRLARARQRLAKILSDALPEEAANGL
jgi:RNA polymerase sigma-70 factor (ECF subfamily)